MKIVGEQDVGRILAIYLNGEAGHRINGKPIRIKEVNEAFVVGYTQVRVLANPSTANDMSLEPVQKEFSEKNGYDCNGKNVGPGSQMLAEATVDEGEVRIPQGSISFITAPKVSDASRSGMPYLNEQVTEKCLNTDYPRPAWQVRATVSKIENFL